MVLDFLKDTFMKENKEKLDKKDVGFTEDLLQFLMNLVSIEHHAHFSYLKSGNKDQRELLNITRKIRSKWMEKLVKESNDQIWCETKHLLSSIMSGGECSNRYSENGEDELSEDIDKDTKTLLGLLLELNK